MSALREGLAARGPRTLVELIALDDDDEREREPGKPAPTRQTLELRTR